VQTAWFLVSLNYNYNYKQEIMVDIYVHSTIGINMSSESMSLNDVKRALALIASNPNTPAKTRASILATAAEISELDEATMKQKTASHVKKEHATLYLCNLNNSNDVSTLLGELNTSPDKKFIKLRSVIKHGDLLEDVSVSGHRSNGIYFFDRSNLRVIKLIPAKERFYPNEIEFITQIHNPYYYLKNGEPRWTTSKRLLNTESNIEDGFASIIYIPRKKLERYSSYITRSDIEHHRMREEWISMFDEDGFTDRFKIIYKGLTYFIQVNDNTIHLGEKKSSSSSEDWYIDLQYDEIKVFGAYNTELVGGRAKKSPKPNKSANKK
jgi:hypothetical protein